MDESLSPEAAQTSDERWHNGSPAATRIERSAPEHIGATRDESAQPEALTWKDRIRLSLDAFRTRQREPDLVRHAPKRVRSYYKRQDELVAAYIDVMESKVDGDVATDNIPTENSTSSLAMAKASFFLNMVLLIVKAAACALSGSLSVISSVVDSSIDLISGILLWYTNRQIERKIPLLYPTGQARLESVAVMILSTAMSVAAFQLIAESLRDIIKLSDRGGQSNVVFDAFTMGVLVATVVLKLIFYIICRRIPTPTAQALSQDHRNDVLSNSVAAAGGFVGQHYWSYADPIAAIAISIYIFFNWWKTGSEQIRRLTGYTAQPDLLSRLTFTCIAHDSRIHQIDVLRAYHFGNKFLVEVHVILTEDITLTDSHDIGSSLQRKLEGMPEVERAFVHLEYVSTQEHGDHKS